MLGRLAGNNWPTTVFGLRGPSERRSAAAWQGFGPRLLCLAGPAGWRRQRTRRCARAGTTARLGQRPAAIIGRARASERAQEVREAMENAGRQLSMAEKGRKGTFHGGRARWRHGRRRRSLEQALPWLKRRHNREHQVSESEAELLALGIGE